MDRKTDRQSETHRRPETDGQPEMGMENMLWMYENRFRLNGVGRRKWILPKVLGPAKVRPVPSEPENT